MPSAAFGGRSRTLDDAGGEAAGLGLGRQAGEHAVADARRAVAPAPSRRLGGDHDARRRAPFLVPFGRHADQLALVVDALDGQHRHGGEVAGAVQVLALALDQALVGHFAKHALQRDAVAAGDAEGAGDLALAGLAVMLGRDECEDRLLAGEAGFGFLLRPACQEQPYFAFARPCPMPPPASASRRGGRAWRPPPCRPSRPAAPPPAPWSRPPASALSAAWR